MKYFTTIIGGLIIAGCVLFQSCSTSYSVITYFDAVHGDSVRTVRNYLEDKRLTHDNEFYLNIQQRVKGIDTTYCFMVDYTTKHGWLSNIDRETMIFYVNGERMEFSSDAGINHREIETQMHETSYYTVTIDQLRQIAQATMVDVQLMFNQHIEVREFRGANFSTLRRFLAENAR